MPYSGRANLYEAAQIGVTTFAGGAGTDLTQTALPLYRCPADSAPDLNAVRLNHGMSNYRAIAGPNSSYYFSPDLDFGGVLYQNSRIAMTDITDGASNTLAIGECIYDDGLGKWAAIWPGSTGLHDGAVWISDAMWWIDENSAVINGPAPQAFSSRHGGGAYFAFCDGSVRFLYEGGDVAIMKYLAGRNDGVIISFDP